MAEAVLLCDGSQRHASGPLGSYFFIPREIFAGVNLGTFGRYLSRFLRELFCSTLPSEGVA
jgi:hypothetical protein